MNYAQRFVDRRLVAGIVALLATVALLTLLGASTAFAPLLHGWLVAFAIFGCVPVGSMVWLLIHRLTGGGWGHATAFVLRPAAAMIPLLVFAFIPVLVRLAHIYPWAASASAISPDVSYWYLNGFSFAMRGAITLFGWSCFAVVFALGLGGQLLAGLGLAFFGLTISFVAVDWILSLEPHYVATAFAATIAIQQLLAALAVAVLIAPVTGDDVLGDLGGLLIATLLGVVYLEFMTFVIAWYGDLPDKAAWFVKRSGAGWVAILVIALTIGALLPFGMLLKRSIRRSRVGLRVASALILVGTVLHFLWLMVPSFANQVAVSAAACAGVVVLIVISILIEPALSRSIGDRHGA